MTPRTLTGLTTVIIIIIAINICKRLEFKYSFIKKYSGFIVGAIGGYGCIISAYLLAFGFDFSYYYYLLPFNVIVASCSLGLGYASFKSRIKNRELELSDVLLFGLGYLIIQSLLCSYLSEWFGWDLNFLYFPWKH